MIRGSRAHQSLPGKGEEWEWSSLPITGRIRSGLSQKIVTALLVGSENSVAPQVIDFKVRYPILFSACLFYSSSAYRRWSTYFEATTESCSKTSRFGNN